MAPDDGDEKPDFVRLFLRGIEHFDRAEFWEAHESWEELWLASSSDAAAFLQGLIQLAAAWHHVRRGTLPGAVRLFDAALARLEPFPEGYCGVDRAPLARAAREHRAAASARLAGESPGTPEYPKFVLLPDWEGRVPPHAEW